MYHKLINKVVMRVNLSEKAIFRMILRLCLDVIEIRCVLWVACSC